MRGHALAQKFADRLFDLFGDVSVSWDAARAIGEIARQDKILTKKNHAVIKVRQKSRGLDILVYRLTLLVPLCATLCE